MKLNVTTKINGEFSRHRRISVKNYGSVPVICLANRELSKYLHIIRIAMRLATGDKDVSCNSEMPRAL